MAKAVPGSNDKDLNFIAMLEAMEGADDNLFMNQTMENLKRCWMAAMSLEMRCVPHLITKAQQSWGAAKAEITRLRQAVEEATRSSNVKETVHDNQKEMISDYSEVEDVPAKEESGEQVIRVIAG